MPLRFAEKSPHDSARVRAHLDWAAQRPRPLNSVIAAHDLKLARVQDPYTVYDLPADKIGRGAGLKAARESGFRYPVENASGEHIAAADVIKDPKSGESRLGSVTYGGDFLGSIARALAVIAKHGNVQKGSYEVRLLRFRAIHAMAVWLKSDDGGKDFIYPVPPAPSCLKAETYYTEAQFLKAVRAAARRAIRDGEKLK